MENKIYKKFNSLENFKKIFFLQFNNSLFGLIKIFFNRYVKISLIFSNKSMFINNGLNFIKINFFLFFTGLPIGQLILTKKHNRHQSFKKIKNQKR